MKTLIVCFAIWIFVVPVAVGLFLIFKLLAASVPDLYFVTTSLALGFSILALVWGPFWLEPFSSISSRLCPKCPQHANSIQEKKYERCVEGEVRS